MADYLQEQINKRIELDEDLFEEGNEVLRESVGDVPDYKDAMRKAKSNEEALSYVLGFFDMDMKMLKNIENEEVLYSVIKLEGEWWKKLLEPLIAFDEEGNYTALIPNELRGYHYYDKDGKKCKVSKSDAAKFTQAYTISKKFQDKPVSGWRMFLFICNYISSTEVVLYLTMSLLAIGLGLLFPRLINRILVSVNAPTGSSVAYVLAVAGTILFAQALSYGLQLMATFIDKRLVNRVSYNVMNAGLYRVLKMDNSQLKGHQPVDIWHAVNSNLKELSSLVVESGTILPITTGFLIAYLIQASHLVKAYTWWIIIALAVFIIITVCLADAGCKYYARLLENRKRENDFNISVIDGIEKIHSMNAEKRIYNLWAKLYSQNIRRDRIRKRYNRIINVITDLFSVVLIAILIFKSNKTGISTDEFVTGVLIIGLINAQAANFGLQFVYIILAGKEWDSAKFIFEADCTQNAEKRKVKGIDGSISTERLSFSYDGDSADGLIIDDVSFNVRPGEYVGIVGSSGCGKSTLLKLLLGLETPLKGVVRYGEYNLARTDRHSIVKQIGIVMQDDTLIPGTLRQNLSLTSTRVTEEDMWEALEAVGIAELVRSFPYGLDTALSSFSAGMSKGQMQRILIARAIISKPKMLIFDEATSALDNISQKKIKEILDGMKCTRIMVAHRLSTIKDCDKILVMDKGRIVEQGNYEELIAKNGLFKELAKHQMVES